MFQKLTISHEVRVSLAHVGHERDETLQARRGRLLNDNGQAFASATIAWSCEVGVGQIQELLAIMLGIGGRQVQGTIRHTVDASAAVWLVGPCEPDTITQAFPPGPKTVVAGWISAIAADLTLWCNRISAGQRFLYSGKRRRALWDSRLQVQQPWARLPDAMTGGCWVEQDVKMMDCYISRTTTKITSGTSAIIVIHTSALWVRTCIGRQSSRPVG